MPANIVDIQRTSAAFSRINGFPRVIGAIDGTHIPIIAPNTNEYLFIKIKGYHSLNLMVCNNNLLQAFVLSFLLAHMMSSSGTIALLKIYLRLELSEKHVLGKILDALYHYINF